MIEQEWNDCAELNGLQANRDGQIRNKNTGYILKQTADKKDYVFVQTTIEGRSFRKAVSRLVWSAFNGPIPEGMQVNHINEDKSDNRLENLNLMSPKENCNWGTRNERIKRTQENNNRSKSILQFDAKGNFIQEWPSAKEIERTLRYDQANISRCCNGIYKTSYNYIWRFKECG